MEHRFSELVHSIQLKLMDGGFDSNDSVVITCSTDNYPPLVEAFFDAVTGLGGDPVLMMHKAPALFGGVSDVTVEAAGSADGVIDVSFKSWAYHESYDPFYQKLTAHGGKRLFGSSMGWEEDIDHIIRLTPNQDVKERTRRAQIQIDNASTIHLKSKAGTDLIVGRGNPKERPYFLSFGGQVAFAPPDESVNGVLYFKGGIRVQAPKLIKRMVYEPIRIDIEKGKVVSIARDTETGIMLDDWFRSHNDPNSYQFAHINLGTDPRIRLEDLDNTSVHYNYAAVLMGYGTNYTPLFGSDVRAKSHIDMNYVGGEYWVDTLCLARDGEFTDESGLRGPFGSMNSINKEGG